MATEVLLTTPKTEEIGGTMDRKENILPQYGRSKREKLEKC